MKFPSIFFFLGIWLMNEWNDQHVSVYMIVET